MFALVRFIIIVFFLSIAQSHAGDVRELAERLEAKAMNGDVASAYKLGLLFSDGKKVSPDYVTAQEWFERAAQRGYVKAMLKLADILSEGKTGQPDPEGALNWLGKAAQKGSSSAMVELGRRYTMGDDFTQAAYWYKKAAIAGQGEAMRELGLFYYEGKGVRFDLAHSYAWLSLGAQKGDGQAKAKMRDIIRQKGESWVQDVDRRIENRMIPEDYWDAR